MANNKFRGFSLAELLISLLIISIVLAAAIPTMTRKGKGSEQIWRWSLPRNSTYFGTGANQAVIIGSATPPLQQGGKDADGNLVTDDNEIRQFFNDPQITANSSTHFTTMGDKLILVKTSFPSDTDSHSSSLINSHISFYNVVGDIAAVQNDISYAGRLAMDKHNIALGIGSLQSLNATSTNSNGFFGNNIAIGHFSLFNDISGIRNVAIGEKTLALNINGNDNVALGFMALTNLNTFSENSTDKEHSQRNTALGSYALIANNGGNDNTAVGANSLMTTDTGYSNTAIGSSACNNINGNYNICIGSGAGAGVEQKSNLSEMVALAKKANHQLVIGSDDVSKYTAGISASATDVNRVVDPLIHGVTAYHNYNGKNFDKQLNINTRYFRINAYDNYRSLDVEKNDYIDKNIFTAAAEYVNGAYKPGTDSPLKGTFDFVLLNDTNNAKTDTHLLLKPYGTTVGNTDIAVITGEEQSGYPSDVRDIIFNNQLQFGFVSAGTNGKLPAVSAGSRNSVNISTVPDGATPVDLAFYSYTSNKATMLNLQDDGFYVNSIQGGTTYPLIQATSSGVSFASEYVNFYEKNRGSGSTPMVAVNTQTGDIYLKALEDNGINPSAGAAIVDLNARLDAISQTYSDSRLKNISGDSKAGLKEINALEVKNYTYKKDETKTPHVGVIAQQLQKVFPNSVMEDATGYLKIKTEEIFYAMVNSIKELCAQIQDLTAKVTGLDKRITELEKQNLELKKQNAEFEKRLEKLEKSVK